MNKIKSFSSKIGIAIVIIILIFFSLKTMVIHTWVPEETATTYAIKGVDGRELKLIFTEDYKIISWYFEPESGFTETVLTDINGTYGTHYFGNLWRLEGPGTKFGFKFYPEDVKPINMELTILKKYMNGTKKSSFGDVGETTYHIFQFGKNKVKFQDMWFLKEPTDQEFILGLLNKLNE